MSSEIMTRWPIRLSLPLDPTDRDEEGELTDAGVTVSIATGVTDAIRDELIALAHGASHFH